MDDMGINSFILITKIRHITIKLALGYLNLISNDKNFLSLKFFFLVSLRVRSLSLLMKMSSLFSMFDRSWASK